MSAMWLTTVRQDQVELAASRRTRTRATRATKLLASPSRPATVTTPAGGSQAALTHNVCVAIWSTSHKEGQRYPIWNNQVYQRWGRVSLPRRWNKCHIWFAR